MYDIEQLEEQIAIEVTRISLSFNLSDPELVVYRYGRNDDTKETFRIVTDFADFILYEGLIVCDNIKVVEGRPQCVKSPNTVNIHAPARVGLFEKYATYQVYQLKAAGLCVDIYCDI